VSAASECGAGWVRVAVEAAACAEPELSGLEAGRAAPGGAAVGRVVEAGEGGAHLLARRVLVGPFHGCGECDVCRRARPQACADGALLGATAPGALGGSVLARARWVVPLDGGLALDGPLAALVPREAADAYALLARAGAGAGDRVAITGRGPVARLARALALRRGVKTDADGPVSAYLAASDDPRSLADTPEAPLVVALARRDLAPGISRERVASLLCAGGALVGMPGAHPDFYAEVAALAVKGELDLAGAATVIDKPDPLADRDALAALIRAALADDRALVISLQPAS
jgi:D-arabinose 1-dehydrogenase-like Zn-dependent alcohol dehydrogenase